MIFSPPTLDALSQDQSLFEHVVVNDLEGHNVSSNEMATEALKHLKKGGGFVEIQHGSHPLNEYKDKHLFPLLYPMLFPYGLRGFELSDCKIPISMKTQAQHLFSLAD